MTKALTGRLLVLLSDRSARMSVAALRRAAGPHIATTLDVRSGHLSPEETEGADAVYFDKLGVALVNVDPRDAARTARIRSAAVENEARILAVEPERSVHAYAPPRKAAPPKAESKATWGLQATGAAFSKFSGKGVKVAVLDTGFDLRHPDYPGRSVTAVSFVKGYKAQDGHGHGTHCIGTACGPQSPFHPPRYGVACEAAILSGKVLDDEGGGADGGILAGINWAITQGARVISMSLGATVGPDTPYSEIFEAVGQRALAAGSLIVAAAGNESDRRLDYYAPVGHPANCPSVLAVGAVDAKLQLGYFSNRGLNPKGGQVDLVAPGVTSTPPSPCPSAAPASRAPAWPRPTSPASSPSGPKRTRRPPPPKSGPSSPSTHAGSRSWRPTSARGWRLRRRM